jgi:hypothetical protein
MIFDGSGVVTGALKAAFPQGKVLAYQSRRADGTAFYDVHSGVNAFFPVPEGKAFFAGETIETPKPAAVPLPTPVVKAAAETLDATRPGQPAKALKPEWKPEAPVAHLKVEPVNDAAKKNEAAAAKPWTPAPPKKA